MSKDADAHVRARVNGRSFFKYLYHIKRRTLPSIREMTKVAGQHSAIIFNLIHIDWPFKR